MFQHHVPIIAILRGITPVDVSAVCHELIDVGITLIEIPLTSPDALDSINIASAEFSDLALIGAGTVSTDAHIRSAKHAGAKFLLSPHFDSDLLHAAMQQNIELMPGVSTATEIFSAYKMGAKKVKLFPASSLGCDYLSSLQAVLPSDLNIVAVGGVDQHNLSGFFHAGATAFGIGSSLYSPRKPLDAIRADAASVLRAYTSSTLERPHLRN